VWKHRDRCDIRVIFGGDGPTGLLVVEQALAAGHDVVAFARTPSKLPRHDRLTVIEGQLDDVTKVDAAMAGSRLESL
jgi:putative NADH-flavin reductase